MDLRGGSMTERAPVRMENTETSVKRSKSDLNFDDDVEEIEQAEGNVFGVCSKEEFEGN
tara:strand:- start:910 stop:1086 length:177 start_codon:yes stop_codon:yes gene_type:complete